MDNSPVNQRSRPRYLHNILIEDDGAKFDVPRSSPDSMSTNTAPATSDFDSEAPYPHTDFTYATSPGSSAVAQSPTGSTGRSGSGQPSPPGTAGRSSQPYYSSSPVSQSRMHSSQQPSHTSYPSGSTGGSTSHVPPPDYYQGVVPFLGPTAASQVGLCFFVCSFRPLRHIVNCH